MPGRRHGAVRPVAFQADRVRLRRGLPPACADEALRRDGPKAPAAGASLGVGLALGVQLAPRGVPH